MNRDEPLTPEERELARLLGRRAEQAPPAALDAAILAAARAAVDAPVVDTAAAPRAPRRRPRWPAVFGIAASMVFAIGIAWQLRPEPPPIPASEAAVAAAPATPDQATENRAADAAMAPPEPAAAAPAAPQAAPMAAPAPAIARTARPAPAEARPAPPPAPAKAEAARARIAEPAADTSFAALPPPASPAPPAPVAYSAPVPASAPAAAAAMKADNDAAPMASAASAEQAPALDRVEVTASKHVATPRSAPGVMRRSGNASLSADAVQAEVNADARLPRRQWLQKIRERRDQGQRDLARASLERYVQQYPEARLPRDLRPLLDE